MLLYYIISYYIIVPSPQESQRDERPLLWSEGGEVLLRGVGNLRFLLIPSEDSACQVPILCSGSLMV